MEEILSLLAASLRQGAARELGVPADALRVRIPARAFDAGCPLAGLPALPSEPPAPALFPPVLGTAPVCAAALQNGWLYFTFSDDFYSALVRHILSVLPAPDSDCGRYALNRMRALSRHDGTGCPADRAVQRALLLAVCAGQNEAALCRAEDALLCMTHHAAPKERAALLNRCGAVYDAASRILFFQYAQSARRAAKP